VYRNTVVILYTIIRSLRPFVVWVLFVRRWSRGVEMESDDMDEGKRTGGMLSRSGEADK
jgi:hypothetical protein